MDKGGVRNVDPSQTRLPLTPILRILKNGIPPYGKASKEAKQALQELLQAFISTVTTEANTICQRDKRRVVSGDDILLALQDLGMNMYSEVLKEYQKSYRRSLTMVPSRGNGESLAGEENVDDKGDSLHQSGGKNPLGCDQLDRSLPDNLVRTEVVSTSDENIDPEGAGVVEKLSTSKVFVGENTNVDSAPKTPYVFFAMRRALGEVDMKYTNKEQLRYGVNTGIKEKMRVTDHQVGKNE